MDLAAIACNQVAVRESGIAGELARVEAATRGGVGRGGTDISAASTVVYVGPHRGFAAIGRIPVAILIKSFEAVACADTSIASNLAPGRSSADLTTTPTVIHVVTAQICFTAVTNIIVAISKVS